MIELNNFVVKPTVFPDKTSQVWKIPEGVFRPFNVVRWVFESEDEVSHVIQLGLLLKFGEYSAFNELHVPFLPYGRQDKDITNNSCFALHMIGDIVSSYYDKLTTFDCHNPEFFYENYDFDFEDISPMKQIADAAEACEATVFCFPDAGAAERYQFDFGQKNLVFKKERDQATGRITGMTLESGDPVGSDDVVLIVDDICDGGRTFIEVAKMLGWAKQICLYVSHGIFSQGTQVLHDAGIERIFTKDGEMSKAEVTSV